MEKAYKLIGLAKKAGKVVSGEKNCRQAIASGVCAFVIIACDVSHNTQKGIIDSCKYHGTEYTVVGNMADLGHSIGNEFNAVVAITDQGLANLIKSNLGENLNGGGSNGSTQNT